MELEHRLSAMLQLHLASIDWENATARRDQKHWRFGGTYIRGSAREKLTKCSLDKPYGMRYLGHCFRWWLAVWPNHFLNKCWLNNGVLWHLLQKKSQEVFNKWTCKMSLKQSLIKLLPHLLGPTNQLTLMLLIVASGVWYILIPRHFDSSMPVTKLINRVSDQHQPVTSCWALWRGMIWYHVMAVSGLVRTQYWCSINTWPRKNWYILFKISSRFAPKCPINTVSFDTNYGLLSSMRQTII